MSLVTQNNLGQSYQDPLVYPNTTLCTDKIMKKDKLIENWYEKCIDRNENRKFSMKEYINRTNTDP